MTREVDTKRRLSAGLLPVFITAGVGGAVFAAMGFFSYLIRYAHLDSLDGQIPQSIYVEVTSMFGIEKALLFGGAALFLIGCTLSIVAGITATRHT